MSCYYLIASLPALSFMKAPVIATEAFLSACEAQLAKKDAAAADWLCQNPNPASHPPPHPFVTDWLDRDTQIRNSVARARAARRKTDASASIRPHNGFDVVIDETVEAAFDHSSPLEREQALDQLRWTLLDELAGVDPFSVNVVLAYAVKLQIANRWAELDSEAALKRIGSALETADGVDHGNSDATDANQQSPAGDSQYEG
jgi:hypothetical protein